jgi:2-C-methyl-D-erythritol 4-phosphate cytidylyltransferase
MIRAVGIIVAAGQGLRMKNDIRKQYLAFGGRPILGHTVSAFLQCEAIRCIFLVVPETDVVYCRRHILGLFDGPRSIELVPGGTERQASVYNGLAAARGRGDIAAIHDGVRPFVRPDLITRCIEGAEAHGACMPGIPVVDTLKQVDATGTIEKTLDRSSIWCAQTPQTFRYDLIWEAHESARSKGIVETDDAALLERLGQPIRMIPGCRFNLKITTPEDLALAPAIMKLLSSEEPCGGA